MSIPFEHLSQAMQQQIKAFFEGDFPHQYKELLSNVLEQNTFFEQLSDAVQKGEDDLTRFWLLPQFTSQAAQKKFTAPFEELQTLFIEINKINQQFLASAQDHFTANMVDKETLTDDQIRQAWLVAGETAYQNMLQSEEYKNTLQRAQDLMTLYQQQWGIINTQQQNDELVEALHQLRREFAEYREETEQKLYDLNQALAKRSAKKQTK